MPDINSPVLTITLTAFIIGIVLYIIIYVTYLAWHEKYAEEHKKIIDKSFYNKKYGFTIEKLLEISKKLYLKMSNMNTAVLAIIMGTLVLVIFLYIIF
tara:strand:+ start:424 stop:717 length:294 start_codon:yes stop_codon:yes gene_type:complete